jgi:hypothetical protein
MFPSELALELLRARFSNRRMLPNLRKLDWDNTCAATRDIKIILPLFISPFLTTIKLTLKNASHAQAAAPLLAPAHNSLRSIYIAWKGPGLVQELSTLLLECNPNQLHEFNVDSPVPWKAFLYASQLPNLRHWTIKPDGMEPPSGASLPTTMFPSLKSLLVKGIDADSIWLQSLARIHSKRLETLGLDLENPVTAKEVLPTAFKYLRSSGLHQTLKKLSIRPQGPDFFGLEIDGRTIEDLPPLNRLTVLDISFICGPDKCGPKLSDEALERLVKAVPNLESLFLGKAPCSRPVDNSIKSLVAIAKHCKRLEKLVIHINGEAVISHYKRYRGEDPILGKPALVGRSLRSIATGPGSWIRDPRCDPEMFVLVLLRLFPRLNEVTGAGREVTREITALQV